jgi:hypothetical protein
MAVNTSPRALIFDALTYGILTPLGRKGKRRKDGASKFQILSKRLVAGTLNTLPTQLQDCGDAKVFGGAGQT